MDTLQHLIKAFDIPEDLADYPKHKVAFMREGLGDLFNDLGFTKGAEIGVEQGEFSEILAKANPALKLYCIDAWKAYKGYRDHTNQDKLEGFYESTKKRLEPYNCQIVRKFSVDASREFEENSLDFVYIDGNHSFYNVVADIHHWLPKVRPGGIICGHDYIKSAKYNHINVVDAVNGYVSAYNIKPLFILFGDDIPSWLWVKI